MNSQDLMLNFLIIYAKVKMEVSLCTKLKKKSSLVVKFLSHDPQIPFSVLVK